MAASVRVNSDGRPRLSTTLHAMGCKDVSDLDINNALLGADSDVHLALDTITVSADHWERSAAAAALPPCRSRSLC